MKAKQKSVKIFNNEKSKKKNKKILSMTCECQRKYLNNK